MTTFDASWSARLRVVGDLERPDHFYLDQGDTCAYFGTYTPRAGYAHSYTNQIISNLKKSPSVRNTPQWKYKENAIQNAGRAIAQNLNPARWHDTTFVPIPPSKRPGSPEYDDRMLRVAQAIGNMVDVRGVLFTNVEREARHTTVDRRDRDALKASLQIDKGLVAHPKPQVVLLDDVLTTGCSFKVCEELIAEIWPDASVFGLFIARRVIPNPFADLNFE